MKNLKKFNLKRLTDEDLIYIKNGYIDVYAEELGVFDLTEEYPEICRKISRLPLVGGIADDIFLAVEMLKADFRGEFVIGEKNKLVLLAGLFYLVAPVDMIPDFMPLIGFTDDATVLTGVLKIISESLSRYTELRKQQNLIALDRAIDCELIQRSVNGCSGGDEQDAVVIPVYKQEQDEQMAISF